MGHGTFQITLYNDDWTAVNPIGMYARRHKISAFYFTISNLPREYRSCLQGIWLVALCNASVVKQCGINDVLHPIVEDLKKLQSDGIFIEKYKTMIYGSLTCFCADNLAG